MKMGKVIKQFIKEYVIQFILALLWAYFSLRNKTEIDSYLMSFVTQFSAAFFLLSWIFGQFLRVKKQMSVSERLDKILNKLEQVASSIQTRTDKLSNFLTGGNSYISFGIQSYDNDDSNLLLTAKLNGEFPMYDITIQVGESYLGGIEEMPEDAVKSLQHFKLDSFSDQVLKPIGPIRKPRNGDFGLYRISVFARNCRYPQLSYVKKGEDVKFYSSNSTYKDFQLSEVVKENTMSKYPKLENGMPDKTLK